jgi:hypothetical protein
LARTPGAPPRSSTARPSPPRRTCTSRAKRAQKKEVVGALRERRLSASRTSVGLAPLECAGCRRPARASVVGARVGCWRSRRLLALASVVGARVGCWRSRRLLALAPVVGARVGCWRSRRLLAPRPVFLRAPS